MKRTIFASFLLLLLVVSAIAQGDKHGQGGGKFDAKTLETITGEVVSLEQITRRNGKQTTQIILKTDKETIPVQLAPARFLDTQEVKIAAQDKIEIKGSRVTFKDKPAIIAAEVKKGDRTLKLRDENGQPAWRGNRK